MLRDQCDKKIVSTTDIPNIVDEAKEEPLDESNNGSDDEGDGCVSVNEFVTEYKKRRKEFEDQKEAKIDAEALRKRLDRERKVRERSEQDTSNSAHVSLSSDTDFATQRLKLQESKADVLKKLDKARKIVIDNERKIFDLDNDELVKTSAMSNVRTWF
jgi:outer membrane protein OmpA-like peptidoglycan-associated protein